MLDERGFAIFNSVAYNLPSAQGDELRDLDGAIMADILRTSTNVADFKAEWYASVDTIDHESTAGAVVIEGKVPGKPHSIASFWVMLGEPVSSVAVPIWVESGRIPAALSQGSTIAIQQQSLSLALNLQMQHNRIFVSGHSNLSRDEAKSLGLLIC